LHTNKSLEILSEKKTKNHPKLSRN